MPSALLRHQSTGGTRFALAATTPCPGHQEPAWLATTRSRAGEHNLTACRSSGTVGLMAS
jgi:hypothetical protein